jgi:predicted Zn-dependent protease
MYEKNANTANNVAQASDTVYNLVTLGYSREDEYFAERLGVKYSSRQCFIK